MKSTFKLFGIIVLSVAVIFSIIACGNDDDEKLPAAKGKMTVVDIPSEDNGLYIFVYGTAGNNIIGMTDIDSSNDPTYKLVKISDGKAVVPLYTVGKSGYTAYEGNGMAGGLEICIVDVKDGLLKKSVLQNAKLQFADDDVEVRKNAAVKGSMILTSGTFEKGNLTVDWRD